MTANINVESADKALSLLGKCMLVAYIGLPLSLVLVVWAAGPPGQRGPFESIVLLIFAASILALLICPILIGVVAARIGKSAIIWGGLSLIFSPWGQLVGYFKIKTAVEDAASVASRAHFDAVMSK